MCASPVGAGADRRVRIFGARARSQTPPMDDPVRMPLAVHSLKAPSARRAAWWLVKPEAELDTEQRAFVETLCQKSVQAKKARELALGFKKMITERQAERFDGWLQAASNSGVRELESFARTLGWDYDAVAAALKYEWSQGQVEGQINKLKLIKKQMYGKANFDLLRQRVLGAA